MTVSVSAPYLRRNCCFLHYSLLSSMLLFDVSAMCVCVVCRVMACCVYCVNSYDCDMNDTVDVFKTDTHTHTFDCASTQQKGRIFSYFLTADAQHELPYRILKHTFSSCLCVCVVCIYACTMCALHINNIHTM